MRFRRRFAPLLRLAHAKERPFLARFTLPPGHRAGSLDVGRFSGLIATHVAADAAAPTLLSYWKSREDFERGGDELRTAAGATAAIEAKHVIHYREPARSIWKRLPWFTIVATLLAIVGAVSTFRSEYRNLWMAPEMVPLPRPGAINYLAGEPIDEPLYVTNHLPVAQRVAVESAQLTTGGRLVDPDVIAIPSVLPLSENSTGEVRLRTIATTPGWYQIVGSLTVRAGYFGGELDAPFTVRLRAWNRDPVLGSLRIRQSDATNAQFEGELLLGTPARDGIVCHVTINRHPELSTVYVRFPNQTPLEAWNADNTSAGAETGSAMFLLDEVEPMKPQRFLIELESVGETDWNRVLESTTVMFSRFRKEGAS